MYLLTALCPSVIKVEAEYCGNVEHYVNSSDWEIWGGWFFKKCRLGSFNQRMLAVRAYHRRMMAKGGEHRSWKQRARVTSCAPWANHSHCLNPRFLYVKMGRLLPALPASQCWHGDRIRYHVEKALRTLKVTKVV